MLTECPNLNDIVFRQGTSIMSHPGNATFRALIAAKYTQVGGNSTDTYKTRVFVDEIMEEIKKMKGRILNWNDKQGCWKVLEDESQIYLKVEYLVRDYRNSARAQMNRQMIESSTSIFCANKRQKLMNNDRTTNNNGGAVTADGTGCFAECFGMKFVAYSE